MNVKNKIEIGWGFYRTWWVLLSAIILVVACSQTVQTPTSVPPTPTLEPTPAFTATPNATPTVVPTVTPTRVPTNTPRPTAQIHFDWDPAGVRPSDADDVSVIVHEISRGEGIVSGYGNEQGITIQYDPTLIDVEEIQKILARIGHPVFIENE